MNVRIKYLLIGLAVLGLAYPGIAWLIGLRAEALMHKREQQALDQFPGNIALISRQYHRGVFSSTEELTFGLGPTVLRALGPLTTTSDLGALQVTVHNSIYHGPLPQLRSFGLATVSTQVQLPPGLSVKLRELVSNIPVIRIRSRLGWMGSSTWQIVSSDYQGRLADGTEISWRGVDATSSANANLSASSLDGNMASFTVKSPKLQVELAGLHCRADWQRVFEVLYTGPIAVKVASMDWQSLPDGAQAHMLGLAINGRASVDGDNYKSEGEYGVESIKLAGTSITHAGFAGSLEHLHGPSLATIVKDIRASQLDAGTTTTEHSAAVLATMKKDGIELLLHEPVLNISRIGFAMPEGELRFSATISAPGLKREELEGSALQAALVQHLDVVADLRVDAALATRLLADNPKHEALSEQIEALERHGYIRRDGAALTTHLAFSGGKLIVNGLTYPPAAGAN